VLPLIASCTKSRPRHCYAQRAHGCWRVRRADGQVARRKVVATLSCAHAPSPPTSPMHRTEPTADRQRRRPRVTAAEPSSSLPEHAHPRARGRVVTAPAPPAPRGSHPPHRPPSRPGGRASTLRQPAPAGTRRVQLVRGEGRDVSSQYWGRDETCPVSTGGAAACPRPARTLSTDLGLRAGRPARWGGRGAGQRGRGRGTSSAAFFVRPTPYPSRCGAT